MTTLFSCSSNDTIANTTSSGTPTETTVAMITRIDGTIYDTPPQNGGNSADVSGGTYGNNYFLLNGYKNISLSKAKIGSKIYEINIVVPKSDISVGAHTFTSTLVSGSYFAAFKVSGVQPAETVNTTDGIINITSYNTTTKLLKGNFNFTTNDGVNLTTPTHSLIGSFTYFLQ